MERSADQERQMQEQHHHGHRRSAGTGGLNGSSSSATRSPMRSACGMLRSLLPSFGFSRGPPLSPSPPARVHQVWPGNNVFFLDGRVICSPDPRGLILSAMALLLSEWIFLDDVVDRSSAHGILVSASSLILLATATVSLLLAATSDPGIIPRNPVSPSEEDGTGAARSAPSRFIVVNGVEMRLNFCRACKINRPPRSSHCAVCDNCVDKFDHHCPLISQCIGLV
nr:probable protein S-acyltransferase 5 [Setaria viridis]